MANKSPKEQIKDAYDFWFYHWSEMDYPEEEMFDMRTRFEWKTIPDNFLEIGIKHGWVSAWTPCTQYLTPSTEENPDIEVRFIGNQICRHTNLLDKNKWRCEIVDAKYLYRKKKQRVECDHKWVPEPREMNEHTTYSCSKCDKHEGCA